MTCFKPLLRCASLCLLVASVVPISARAGSGFEILRSLYESDPHLPLEMTVSADQNAENVRRVEFTFAAYDNQIVPARLDIPVNFDNPPVIVALHGLTQSRAQWWRKDEGPYSFPSRHRSALIDAGFAVLAIDARAHGDRLADTDFQDQSVILQNGYNNLGRHLVSETVLDVRRALDALEQIKGVDHDRIGLTGFSLGAFIGNIAVAVDPRIDAGFIMALPFLPVSEGQSASFTSPFQYVEGLSGKDLTYLAATQDFLYTREIVDAYVQTFAGAPDVIWVESDHDFPSDTAGLSVAFFESVF